MILIIDSGSTKSDCILLSNSKLVNQVRLMGFNPFFHNEEFITNAFISNTELSKIRTSISAIYYYGAGCSTDALKNIVFKALSNVFVNATIKVDHDLTAAAYATYNGEPSISCILGTGSNSCFFDGKTVSEATPSLAYVLGDEGSGNYFGKKLIAAYLYKLLPNHLHQEFKKEYNLSKDEILENVYWKPHANVYLASFCKFISDRKSEPFFRKMILEGLREFISIHICAFPNHKEVPVHFVGSVAFYFESEIRLLANDFNITIGNIIQRPINGLVEYHLDKTI